jgi:hypothetical protein
MRDDDLMPSLEIRDLPGDVLAVLERRAALSERTLQQYLLEHLVDLARRPTLDEMFDRASGRTGASLPFDRSVATAWDDRARQRHERPADRRDG